MAYAIQNTRDKQKLGSKAPWYAVWKDVDGKKHRLKVGKRGDALDIAQERERKALRSANGCMVDETWSEFRKEYERLALPLMRSARSRLSSQQALTMFETLVRPKLVRGIDGKTLQSYVVKRKRMRGLKPKSTVSAETIKKELRTVRAALSFAHEWGYLQVVPKLPKVEGFESEKRFVTLKHFDMMLGRCHVAQFPAWIRCDGRKVELPYAPGLWWEALLSLLWVAPNRIGAMLALRWEHVDFETGTITSRPSDTKQKKLHRACVPAVVLDKLARIETDDVRVFPWNHANSTLYRQFVNIQKAAEICLPCHAEHEHTDYCHYYGFHDFRRSFATLNGQLPVAFQQNQMGHSTYATTMRYVKFGEGQRGYADQICLPTSLAGKAAVES